MIKSCIQGANTSEIIMEALGPNLDSDLFRRRY